ncbi:hypothetical protein RF11_15565 [Thelohanellus kitauei]|uniref:Uncharacterized protein n=1 Tax=Thelohanellus kitauei TaxID=669202 RepID=A0A0C2I6F8_THEKT|nr:hypothetical protein RF11_15565 [Thelohanellus kitauei]
MEKNVQLHTAEDGKCNDIIYIPSFVPSKETTPFCILQTSQITINYPSILPDFVTLMDFIYISPGVPSINFINYLHITDDVVVNAWVLNLGSNDNICWITKEF